MLQQSLMKRLKTETQAAHEAVEALVDLTELTTSRDRYVAHLCALWGLHQPLEEGLAELDWSVVAIDFEGRRRADLLRSDLKTLAPGASVDTLCLCEQLPALETIWQGLGCLYVLEGSRLGGQIIARALQKNLDLTGEQGRQFLTGGSQDLSSKWKEFSAAVDQAGEQAPDKCGEVVAAARVTFECFYGWLQRVEINE